jgi:hypothetical protein
LPPASARTFGAVIDEVGFEPSQAGDNFSKTEFVTIRLFPQVGSQNRCDLIRNAAVLANFATQCRWVVVGINAIDNHRDHKTVRMAPAKKPNLLVNRQARRGDGRAQDDQSRRAIESVDRCVFQFAAAYKVIAIAKNRGYETGHCAALCLAADEIPINTHAFKSAVQPPRPS